MSHPNKTQTNYMIQHLQSAAHKKNHDIINLKYKQTDKFNAAKNKIVAAFFKKHPGGLKAIGTPCFEYAGLSSDEHYIKARVEVPPALLKQLAPIIKKHESVIEPLNRQQEEIQNQIAQFEAECILGDLTDVREQFNKLLEKLSK